MRGPLGGTSVLTKMQKSVLHYADLFGGKIDTDRAISYGYGLRTLRSLASNGYLAEGHSSWSLTEKGYAEVVKINAAAQQGHEDRPATLPTVRDESE